VCLGVSLCVSTPSVYSCASFTAECVGLCPYRLTHDLHRCAHARLPGQSFVAEFLPARSVVEHLCDIHVHIPWMWNCLCIQGMCTSVRCWGNGPVLQRIKHRWTH
jgi:hypothetical protein